MAETSVAPHVRRYFETHPDEEIKPGPLTRWVGEQRGIPDQSAGAVRSAITTGEHQGWITRLPGTPLRYKYRPSGTPAPAMPKSTPPPPPRKSVVVYNRPSGERYHPRQIGDFIDVEMLRKAAKNHLFVLLYGPPGAGKTALVEAAFPNLITMAGDADTGVPDFTGDFGRLPKTFPAGTPDDEMEADLEDAWIDGPLVRAMTANGGKGVPLFVDDATLIPPGVMSVVYPGMDGRGKINVKSRPRKLGREIMAGPEFYVIAAHNPGVPGAILSEALSSRFVLQIEVTTDYNLARSQGVNSKAVTVASNLEKQRKNGQVAWAPQMRELLAFKATEKQFDTATACMALIAQAPEGDDREAVQRAIAVSFGAGFGKMEPLALGGQV